MYSSKFNGDQSRNDVNPRSGVNGRNGVNSRSGVNGRKCVAGNVTGGVKLYTPFRLPPSNQQTGSPLLSTKIPSIMAPNHLKDVE